MFRGRYDRQQTLAIRIAAITLASDSAITIARFRPSKAAALIEFWFKNGRFSKTPKHSFTQMLFSSFFLGFLSNAWVVVNLTPGRAEGDFLL